MTRGETFQCSVVTPERVVLECEARFVAFPAWDGEIGILRNRAPLLCKLGIGALRVESPSESHVLFLDGGFAEMADNRLTILTETAKHPDELDPEAVESGVEEARAMKVRDDESFEVRQAALQRARVQRRLLESS